MALLPPVQNTVYGSAARSKRKPKKPGTYSGGFSSAPQKTNGSAHLPGGTNLGPTVQGITPPKQLPSFTPDPPGAPAASPMPLDVTALRDFLAGKATAQADSTLASLKNQQTGLLSDAGYNATFKDVGNGIQAVDKLTVDPSNPFSRAALLQRSYDQRTKGNTNSMAAQGQLYSGALQNAQNDAAFDMQQSDDAIKKALKGSLDQNLASEYSARQSKETATTDAGWQALLAALGKS